MKKGLIVDLKTITIILITLLVIIIPTSLWAQQTAQNFERERCSQSATTQASYSIAEKKLTSLLCPTYDIVISDERATYTYNYKTKEYVIKDSGKKIKEYKELKEEYVYQILGNELNECWKQFGKGQLDIFNKNYFEDILSNNKVVCFPCDTITFDLENPTSFEKLSKYLFSTPYENTDLTYQQFLFQKPPSQTLTPKDLLFTPYPAEGMGLNPDPILSSQDVYYLVFLKKGGQNAFREGSYAAWLLTRTDYNTKCDEYVSSYTPES